MSRILEAKKNRGLLLDKMRRKEYKQKESLRIFEDKGTQICECYLSELVKKI